jgi:hypothetical protein
MDDVERWVGKRVKVKKGVHTGKAGIVKSTSPAGKLKIEYEPGGYVGRPVDPKHVEGIANPVYHDAAITPRPEVAEAKFIKRMRSGKFDGIPPATRQSPLMHTTPSRTPTHDQISPSQPQTLDFRDYVSEDEEWKLSPQKTKQALGNLTSDETVAQETEKRIQDLENKLSDEKEKGAHTKRVIGQLREQNKELEDGSVDIENQLDEALAQHKVDYETTSNLRFEIQNHAKLTATLKAEKTNLKEEINRNKQQTAAQKQVFDKQLQTEIRKNSILQDKLRKSLENEKQNAKPKVKQEPQHDTSRQATDLYQGGVPGAPNRKYVGFVHALEASNLPTGTISSICQMWKKHGRFRLPHQEKSALPGLILLYAAYHTNRNAVAGADLLVEMDQPLYWMFAQLLFNCTGDVVRPRTRMSYAMTANLKGTNALELSMIDALCSNRTKTTFAEGIEASTWIDSEFPPTFLKRPPRADVSFEINLADK